MAKKQRIRGDEEQEAFGRRLARYRKAAGYSQREFALEIGISYRMVAYYEAQTERPPTRLIPVIAKVLGVSADQLLGLEPIGKRQPPIDQRLLRHVRKLQALPPRDQRAVLRYIDLVARDAKASG